MWSGADAAKPRLVRRRNAKAEGGLQGAPFASRGGLPLRWSDGDVSVVHAGADDVWQVTAPNSGQVRGLTEFGVVAEQAECVALSDVFEVFKEVSQARSRCSSVSL
jgi:hypothetical protein